MQISKSKLTRKIVVLGLSLVVALVGISLIDQKFHLFSKANKLVGEIAGVGIVGGSKFLGVGYDNVSAQATTPYQNVDGDVNVSGRFTSAYKSNFTNITDSSIYLVSNDPAIGILDNSSPNTSGYTIWGSASGGLAFSTATTTTPPAEKIRFDINGNVGIGTATPQAKLDIFQSGAINTTTPGTTRYGLHLTPQNATVDTAAGITFGAGDSGSGQTAQAGIYSQFSGTYGTKMYFATTDAYVAGAKTRMMIDHLGNVGIGTRTPGQRLEVNNTIKLTNTGMDANDGVIGVGTFAPGLNIVGIQTDGLGRKVQIWGYTTFVNGYGNDLAENYFIPGKVIRGSLVSIDYSTPSAATAADPSHKSLLGIVSTNPGAVMDADGGFHIGYGTKEKYTNEKAPIALAGTAPALVTSQNDPILIGDPIGLSYLAGFGAKATAAGQIVGRAFEKFNPADSFCTPVSSIDAIIWPNDDGKNPAKPCFKLPNGTYIGKIMVSVSASWYDPDVNLTSTDNFRLDFGGLKDSANNLITRIGAFGKLIAGKIQAGIIETQTLIVNGVDILERLNTLSQKVEAQQKEIEVLRNELEQLKTR